ncbi:hypothetical protein SAMN05444389_11445 [Paracoccus solventivorans]|uniref:Uncharacterized protein n=1 Tax=Paracoccus solventivorans TaxID=53463 RepID=A0A1M7JX06_9RHOB|nr:hypothetical protein [Paracoccus solventivorans]SHM57556.1 hypothetical protein SAMN05444389_11445 [Paracoccus solventivorans]
MEKRRRARAKGKRLFVRAIAEIIDPATGQIVGAQYQWNTGERRLEWFGEKVADYRLRPLEGQDERGGAGA